MFLGNCCAYTDVTVVQFTVLSGWCNPERLTDFRCGKVFNFSTPATYGLHVFYIYCFGFQYISGRQ